MRDLYVQFAWNISHPALLAAIDLARTANVHLWLVGDSPYSDYHSELLAPHHPREWTGVEFLDHWSHLLTPGTNTGSSRSGEEKAPTPVDSDEIDPNDADANDPCDLGASGSSPSTSSGWPTRLPDDDFTTFRAACRDRLSPSQFERVDAAFIAGVDDARTSLVPMLTSRPEPDAGPEEVDGERAIAEWFARRWEDTESLQHFQVAVRAAQVAAFGAGYFVQVNLDQLVGTAETTPRRAQRDVDTWGRLRAYPQPHRSAACALAAAGMALSPMTRLPINAFDAETGIVLCDNGDWFTVEPAARVFVAAQQTLRRLQGAEPHELLLVNPTDGRPIAPRTLAAAIRLARREVGAAVALAPPDTLALDPSRWYRRWGISIQKLT